MKLGIRINTYLEWESKSKVPQTSQNPDKKCNNFVNCLILY